MPTRKTIRNSTPSIRYQKRNRQKEFTMFWVLAVVFLATMVAVVIEGSISGSLKSNASMISLKVLDMVSPRVNELTSEDYIRRASVATGEIEEATVGVFDNEEFQVPNFDLARETSNQVLAASVTAPDGSEKWIEVDLSDQTLKAWEGNRLTYELKTSTGRPGYETVTGEFRVWRKVAYQRYIGGSKVRGDYYNLPNVPYSLFFHKGYAIHGAYWHSDFGVRRRSSGCVNLSPADAQKIFEWAGPSLPAGVNALNSSAENPGVRIVVHQ